MTGTIVVEASPLLEDNQWLLDLAKDEPVIVGIVGHLTPGDKDFAGHLERFAKSPLFRGIRVNHGALAKGLEDAAYVEDLRRLAGADLALDVNGGPELLAVVARTADKLPKLRIVINHCANLRIDGQPPPAEWLAGMRAAAGHERVWCKVSALVEGAGRGGAKAPAEFDFYRPVLGALGPPGARTASSSAATGPSAAAPAHTPRSSTSPPAISAKRALPHRKSSWRKTRRQRTGGLSGSDKRPGPETRSDWKVVCFNHAGN